MTRCTRHQSLVPSHQSSVMDELYVFSGILVTNDYRVLATTGGCV